jgi:RNA polymerase sigma factor (sigma-70 family)
MTEPPLTRPSLLVRLRDARDADAWGQFVRLYAPLVYGYARKRGLQDADAADLTQEVLRAVARAAGRLEYDPRRGTFHGWLFTVVRNKVSNFLTGRRPVNVGTGLTSVQLRLEEQPAPAGDDARQWDEDYRRQLFARAAAVVRGAFHSSTWLAFWRTAVEGRRPRDVAAELGLSVAAVYMARSRVTAQLKKQMRQWHED